MDQTDKPNDTPDSTQQSITHGRTVTLLPTLALAAFPPSCAITRASVIWPSLLIKRIRPSANGAPLIRISATLKPFYIPTLRLLRSLQNSHALREIPHGCNQRNDGNAYQALKDASVHSTTIVCAGVSSLTPQLPVYLERLKITGVVVGHRLPAFLNNLHVPEARSTAPPDSFCKRTTHVLAADT